MAGLASVFRSGLTAWRERFGLKAQPEHPTALKRVIEMLDREKVPYRLVPHFEAFTASELAESIHIPGRMVAKVVLVWADDRTVMAVLPSHRRLDLLRLADTVGAKRAELSDENALKKLFPDCEVGAMPPFGNLYGIPVYVDGSLASEAVIFFPAGSHREVLEIRFQDFRELARARVGHFLLEPVDRASGF